MFSYTNIALLCIISACAGFIQRVSGFGLGIFVMLFLPHFMPSHTAAAAISGLFSCGTSTYNAVRYRKDIPLKTALPPMIASMVTIPVAVYFSASVSGNIFNVLLGSVLICLSIYFLFFNRHLTIKPTKKNGLIAGALGGTLNGLFSTGGPPAVLYFTHATADNISYFSAIQFYFCITNIYATLFRAINRVFTAEILIYSLIGFIACMIGDKIGVYVFDKLDSAKLKTVIYIGMIISGIIMILGAA